MKNNSILRTVKENNKILVTGGAGYIGSHAVKLLLEKKYKVVVIDNLYRGYLQVIEQLQKKYGFNNLIFYKSDLRNYQDVLNILQEEKPDAVLHFAALCLVNESMEKPEDYFENNVIGSINLLKAMLNTNVKKLVFSSTCAVYGENQYLPVDEKHPTNPTNPYGESKLMTEKIIKWFSKTYGFNYSIFRYFNVSGAFDDGSIGDSKKPSQLLMQNAVRGALKIEPFKLTCPKVATSDGTPIRDYVNVVDLVTAHVVVLDYLKKGILNETFNLGSGKGNSVMEIINQVKSLTGFDFVVQKTDVRKGEYAEIYADITKVSRALSWKPERSVKKSVESMIKWYKKNPNGWEY